MRARLSHFTPDTPKIIKIFTINFFLHSFHTLPYVAFCDLELKIKFLNGQEINKRENKKKRITMIN